MFGRSWSAPSAHSTKPRPVQAEEGLRAQKRRTWHPSSEVPEGGHEGGAGEGEDEGNAGMAVRLQEGLLPAEEAEMQE